jgi:hypothetical protein
MKMNVVTLDGRSAAYQVTLSKDANQAELDWDSATRPTAKLGIVENLVHEK